MDAIDRLILARLRENGRAPVSDLARAVSLSRTTVQSRLARMEAEGVITGYSVRLAEAVERGRMHAYVLVTVSPKQSSSVTAQLKRMPDVRSLKSVSGPFDLIAAVITDTAAEMDRLIDSIGSLEGVERTTSSIVLSTKFER